MASLWTDTVEMPRFEALEGDAETEVLVIGGGLAGLLCAWELDRAGADTLLVEATQICGGVTKNTTAKITSQHGLIYDALRRRFDLETAGLYLKANQEALEKYRTLCAGIDCDFQERDAFVYALEDRYELEKELKTLEALGFPARLEGETELPFPVAGALRFPRQAQFHPLKFAAAIGKGLRIREHTKVLELQPGLAVTNRGRVRAKKIVVATHFPLLNKHGGYFLKLYQQRSYVLALKGAAAPEGMYVDESAKGLSFRSWGELLLLGGGGHRTGKKGGGWRELSAVAARYYPQAREAGRWATQDCMSLDGLPYVGRYSPRTPELYVAAGFNKWGMTSSMAAASLLCDLIRGRKNAYEGLFSPQRGMLRPQLAVNCLEAAVNLLTPTVPRCPHMGCALKYNPQERSWDCPCHGSRFTETGQLIDNPATDDKRF